MNLVIFYFTIGAIELAEILGSKSGRETLNIAWKMQGESSFSYFLSQVKHIYKNCKNQENKSYMIFSIGKILKYIKIENQNSAGINNESTNFEISKSIFSLIKNTFIQQEQIDFIKHIKRGKFIFDLDILLEILLYFEKTALDHIRFFEPICKHLSLYKSFKELFFRHIEYFIHNGSLQKKPALQSKLLACVVFLLHFDIIEQRNFFEIVGLIFDKLNSENIRLREEPFYRAVIQLYPLTTDFVKVFHIMATKFPSEV